MSEDLETDPFLNSALQRFTCELYYGFGSFLAPLSAGLITSRHHLSKWNKNGRTNSSTTSNDESPKKVEVGKRLAEYNCRKREELKAQKCESKQVEPMLTSSQYYGIGAVLAVGVLVITFTKPRKEKSMPCLLSNALRLTSLKWSKFLLYYKMDKKNIVNDLYQAAVISVFAVGYSMLGRKILKMAPLSIQKFDLEDTGKLVGIVAVSEMTREYLIKQKILPEPINV